MNKIRLSGLHHEEMKKHLFPGDGKEAVGIALCGRSNYNGNYTLLVKEFHPIPYEVCFERREDFVHWPTEFINPLLEKASKKGLAILKIHCHPTGFNQFSKIDNESDNALFASIHSWLDDSLPHASCVMLPDGRMFGRFFNEDIKETSVHHIAVAGSDLLNWYYTEDDTTIEATSQIRNEQAFGKKTVKLLNRLKVGIVGCSGTGSPVIEQLKRLGVGEFVLVDPDYIDSVNLNRIVGSTINHTTNKTMKVDVMAEGIELLGIGTKVKSFAYNIVNESIIKELADCDVLFGCVDSAEGRHVLNLISSYYLVPLIDLGVKFEADGKGGIEGIFGSVHYIQPFGSSLISRKQYSPEQLVGDQVKRIDNEEYERNQYLAKANESNPAVISVNVQIAGIAVNELLARLHPYRNFDNSEVDVVKVSFADCTTFPERFTDQCAYFSKFSGSGDISPLLNYTEFTINVKENI
ncbi:ThiF family adenylyltransferase [Flavobacterium oreochromis]|uniref:ThiF family adenylyltransferase n=1 Tax=Flavobacterium oreochromis TaxID=2906078 RepID=UPI00385D67E2